MAIDFHRTTGPLMPASFPVQASADAEDVSSDLEALFALIDGILDDPMPSPTPTPISAPALPASPAGLTPVPPIPPSSAPRRVPLPRRRHAAPTRLRTKRATARPLPRGPSARAIQLLFGAARDKPCHRFGLLLMGVAGLKAREVALLRACDVHARHGRWWVVIRGNAPGLSAMRQRPRVVPLAPVILEHGFLDCVAHARAQHHEGFLFPRWATGWRPGDALHYWTRSTAKRLGLRLSPKDLCDGFAFALARAGCKRRIIATVMGRGPRRAPRRASLIAAAAVDCADFRRYRPAALKGRPFDANAVVRKW